ncbi:hypothetical protein F5051DRAFT_418732 [Lentinula edodes]|nr:hypothetical protein F5051DRAFT_418732 [Lentinula edodes]
MCQLYVRGYLNKRTEYTLTLRALGARQRLPAHLQEPRLLDPRSVLIRTRHTIFIFRTAVRVRFLFHCASFDLLYLHIDGTAVLGPESSSGYFTIGTTISLPGDDGTTLYLNVDTSDTTVSYQALTFGPTAVTTDWGLEGDTIIETDPRQLNFLNCATSDATVYSLYLQTGNDSPTGQTCSLTSLHLDCLC